MDNSTLYLVDGSSIVYRSFYAIQLSTSKGFPTGAIYGSFNMLRKIIKQHNCQYMAVCFDVSRKTFRQEKYSKYKIQRPAAPDALNLQMPKVKEIINLLGVSILEEQGFEADDIIASLTKKAADEKRKVVIITTDKDMYQLIDGDRVTIYNPFKDKLYDEEVFKKDFGFLPVNMADFLALTGDSSDNIPGARGIGPKGATTLIKEYKTIENIYEKIEDISKSLKNKLIQSKDDVLMSKDLVLLDFSLSEDLNLEDLKIKDSDNQSLCEKFKQYEFRSLLNEIGVKDKQKKVEVINGLPKSFLEDIKGQDYVCFYYDAGLMYLFDKEKKLIYGLEENDISLFLKSKVKKVSFGVKPILRENEKFLQLNNLYCDLEVASYVLNSSLGDYSFESLCFHYLGLSVKDTPKDQYVCIIDKLYSHIAKEIKDTDSGYLVYDVETPLTIVLADMEKFGINIDLEELRSLSSQVDKKIVDFTKEIFKISKTEFNLNSPKQLQKILFEDLNIPPVKKTKTGFSTNEEVLNKLEEKFPIAGLILNYRHFNKLQSTYLLPFIEQVTQQKGRIHAFFNQTVTQTGRLSSSSPNLQNIPVRGEFAQKIRKVFIPSKKNDIILSSDYSQIELRILAHFSKEKKLIEAFKKDYDIHKFTASLLFDVDEKDVTKKQREVAKRVNFGIVYGISSFGLSRELKVFEPQAREFIENYFSRYPKVKKFLNSIYEKATEEKQVTTMFNRRRFLYDIDHRSYDVREFVKRQATNTPIQGSAADIIKIAMVKIFDEFAKKKIESKMILQVHDELVFDVKSHEKDKVIDIVKNNMENCVKLSVPLTVNMKMGPNWLDMKAI